jgi:chromosome segregation ATPase
LYFLAVFFGMVQGLYASDVALQEIPLSLYNKPVTGYRLTLDRSQRFVEQQIIKHIGESISNRPFQYERTMIYENVRYRPVASDQDISLYFLLRSIENQYTEVTVVAMYDFRRSISTREFPALSQLLKLDLARFVRRATGDMMRDGDVLYDDATITQLRTQTTEERPTKLQPGLGEEEVERAHIARPRDGFKDIPENGDPDTTIALLRRRVAELEAREGMVTAKETDLEAQSAELTRKQTQLQAKLSENKLLRDSIHLLNQRVQAMLGQYYVSDDISVSNETAERIFKLEQDVKRQRAEISALQRTRDSLQTLTSQYASQAESISKGRQSLVEEVARLKSDNERLEADVNRLRADLDGIGRSGEANADSLIAQLRIANRKYSSQMQELSAVRLELDKARNEKETADSKAARLEERIGDLEVQNRDLTRQSGSPAPPVTQGSLKADRDSINQLRARITYLEAQSASADQQGKRLGEKEESLRKSEAENRNLRTQLGQATLDLRSAEDQRKLNEQKLAASLSGTQTAQAAATSAQRERDIALREQATLQTRLANVLAEQGKSEAIQQTLRDTIASLERTAADRQNQLQKRDAQIRREILRQDSLAASILAGTARENDLRRQTDLLQTKLDSLARAAQPETEQQRFLREQRSKLAELEKQLDARNNTTTDQEKLLAQRKTTQDQREADLNRREQAVKDLEERERQVQMREQQSDIRESINGTEVNPQDIRENMVVEFGSSVPVFSVKTPLSYRPAQRQVVAYMLSRDILLSAQFPDLLFQNISLPEISEGQIEIKVRIDNQGGTTVLNLSFRLPDGSYLGTEKTRKQNDSAKQLIVRMLRYKN